MSLSFGPHYLAIPGPSVMPDAVLRAMHRGSENIYEGPLIDMAETVIPDLCKVAGTAGNVAMYISNGHGMWEAALVNVSNIGDRVLNLSVGSFGRMWGQTACELGRAVVDLDFGNDADPDPQQIKDALRADPQITAVLMTHVDTSSGRRCDVTQVSAIIRELGHQAILMVDCIASMGCDRFEMDAMGADVAITSSQKGLMTPAGMGFVFFNQRAEAAHARVAPISPYWNWAPRSDATRISQRFCGTNPAQHLHGLRTALDMILAEGMDSVWARHEILAKAIWAAVDHWGQEGTLAAVVREPAHRSHAVTALTMTAPDGERLRRWCEEQAGMTLGIGLGLVPLGSFEAQGHFRLGHMGYVTAQMILGMLATIETGLTALDIAHQRGGVLAASQVIADHTAA